MLDIKWIRQEPEQFDAAMQRRGSDIRASSILALDEQKRALQTEAQELRHKRKELAKEIGQLKAKGENADTLLATSKEVNAKLDAIESRESDGDELSHLLATIPNVPDTDVPDGDDETANQEIRQWGTPKSFDFEPKQHFDLGEQLGMMDFEQSAKISGSRFVTLKGELSRLERALAHFMLDLHTQKFGFTEISPPLLVRDATMFASGQLPKFAEDSFETTNGYRLIPTSEVSLVTQVMDRIIDEAELPVRYTAYTPCFRSEAGSAGKDTRGMIRLHQFSKVELVSVTTPETSADEHEYILGAAEEVLKQLELPYRVVNLCTGDLGFCAHKTYDIEVWLPGQNAYREISSCSNFGTFQSRRMKARYRKKNEKENHFVHTLNGSGLAVGRTVVAVLENYQQADGTILIPDALRPYMGGITTIGG